MFPIFSRLKPEGIFMSTVVFLCGSLLKFLFFILIHFYLSFPDFVKKR